LTARIISGTEIAQQVRREISIEVEHLRTKTGAIPGLAAVLVGDDPASQIYVRNKGRACKEVGIHSEAFHLPASFTENKLLDLILELNSSPRFNGILVQLPLPPNIDEKTIIQAISPEKDVDGLHPNNLGRLIEGNPRFVPGTPAGIQQLLLRSGYDTDGKHAVVCGRSNIVGKPMALLLMQKNLGANATVTLCHTGTKDLAKFTKDADILVVATGRPNTIDGSMVKPGVVVIDVGINRIEDSTQKRGYRLAGDVDFESVSKVAEAITPVPGGVGPMTIAMLLQNTLFAAKEHHQSSL
jgi:methylenetetrahydrofolate dehydrogenase (NADP+)/methenyltetrahydrofolate cyclohydrolase